MAINVSVYICKGGFLPEIMMLTLPICATMYHYWEADYYHP